MTPPLLLEGRAREDIKQKVSKSKELSIGYWQNKYHHHAKLDLFDFNFLVTCIEIPQKKGRKKKRGREGRKGKPLILVLTTDK